MRATKMRPLERLKGVFAKEPAPSTKREETLKKEKTRATTRLFCVLSCLHHAVGTKFCSKAVFREGNRVSLLRKTSFSLSSPVDGKLPKENASYAAARGARAFETAEPSASLQPNTTP